MSEPESSRTFYWQGSWMVTATFVSGVLMFAVHFFGVWMSRTEYGLFVTLLQILNLMMIPTLGLQIVFARKTAAALDLQQRCDLAQATRSILFWCLAIWLTVATGTGLFQKIIIGKLEIENAAALWVTLLLGLPQLCLPVLLGILQGRQNFKWLGGAAIANGAGRFAIVGVVVVLLHGQAAGAITGALVGLTLACVIAGWHGRQTWRGVAGGRFEARHWLASIIPLTLGLGAGQFMLSADMVAARILSVDESGPYGAAGMIGRGLVIFTAPLAAVMFPKLVRDHVQSRKTGVMSRAFLATALLSVLTAGACSAGAWLLPKLLELLPADAATGSGLTARLNAKSGALVDIARLVPPFIWSMLPLALANVLVAALLACEQYRAVPWLTLVAAVYGGTLFWIASGGAGFTQTGLIGTLGLFNGLYLCVAGWFQWRSSQTASTGSTASGSG